MCNNGMFGGNASFITLKPNVYSATGNTMWHVQHTFASHPCYQMYIDPEIAETDYEAVVYRKLAQNEALQRAAGNPKVTFDVFWRTEEEDEIFYEYNPACASHTYKSRAEFAAGIRDPYDDAEWEKYLNELRSLKYEEYVLPIAQASYERSLAGTN